MPRVVVRLIASAAPSEGRGHLARALAVAEALAALDVRATLELLRGTLTVGERQRLRSLETLVIAAGPARTGGATPQQTATLVDLPDPNEADGRADPKRLAVMDDGASFRGAAALIIQPSSAAWSGKARAGRAVAGWEWVPVRAEFRRLRERPRLRDRIDRPPRVFIGFGGSDPARVASRLVPEIVSDGGAWRTEVVLGPDDRSESHGWRAEVHRDPADLPGHLADADLAVLGSGTMKFEAACLGVPAILLAVSDDQLRVGPEFAATGAAIYLGDGRTVAPTAVRHAIEELLADAPRREALSRTAAATVDGRGAERIARELIALAR